MRQKIAALVITSLIFSVVNPVLAESETKVQYNQETTVYAGEISEVNEIISNTEIISLTSKKQKPVEILKRLEDIEQIKIQKNKSKWKTGNKGYVSKEKINVYTKRNSLSEIITTLDFNTKIKYAKCEGHPHWYRIQIDSKIGYVKASAIADNIEYKSYELTSNSYYKGFKSWMGHRCFSLKSNQGKLQQIATTDNKGLRKVNNRYTVAIGSHFNCDVGQYFDIILKNGTVISAICGDWKANKDTDSTNVYTRNGCATEFIVETTKLCSAAKSSGDISSVYDEWDSPVIEIYVYNMNVLN